MNDPVYIVATLAECVADVHVKTHITPHYFPLGKHDANTSLLPTRKQTSKSTSEAVRQSERTTQANMIITGKNNVEDAMKKMMIPGSVSSGDCARVQWRERVII